MAVVNEYYLFTFCEWLDRAAVTRALPAARLVTTGMVEDCAVRYVVCVDDQGNRYRGESYLADAPGEVIHGAVWKITVDELETLDRLAGVGEGRCTRTYRAVLGDNGQAYAAVAHMAKRPVSELHLSATAMENIMAGARSLGLPPEYCGRLAALSVGNNAE